MFATLIGPYPRVPGTARERLVATISDQLEAGLGMLTDGRVYRVTDGRSATAAVAAWRAADAVGRQLAAGTGIEPPLIKACLMGPWTAGKGEARRVHAAAAVMVPCIAALFDAGAPVVQVTDPGIGDIAADDKDPLRVLCEALETLTGGSQGHVSLALAGGQPTTVPYERLFAAPFASYLFDVIRSPDDWRLCARAPAPSGLIVCVADARTPEPDGREVSIWGARYAASMAGRGPERVGLSTSAGLERLPRQAARAKLRALADAARMAELPDLELAAAIDPRAVDARSAALGRYAPRPRLPGRRGPRSGG